MKNISQIYIVLSFFIYIISCSIIFMILKDIYNRKSNKKVEELKTTFGNEVLRQLNGIKLKKNISKINLEYINTKLSKITYYKVFNSIIVFFNEDEENHKFTKQYIENFEMFILKGVRKNSKKDDTMKSYQAFLLGEYRLNNFEINEFLFDGIKSKSIYLRVASLKSISKIGNLNNFINALLYISDENKYINNKILIDIINQFEGDKNILNKELIDKFNLFNAGIQKVIIENFRKSKTTFVKEDLVSLLKDESCHKETRISIIKYFSTIKHDEANSEIIKILNEEDWEYRAICATALSNYKDEESKIALLYSISDKNWHVRYNSAITLLKFKDNNIIDKVMEKNDKYSRDIIFYAMFMENKISYDEYLQNLKKIEVESIC